MGEVPKGFITKETFEPERQQVLDLARATTMLLSDSPQDPVDAIFLFSRSFFDAGKQDIFRVATDFIQQGKAKYILLADSEGERVGEAIPRVANPGKSLWTDRFVRLGVPQDQIVYCPHPTSGERGFHTRSEGDAFVNTLTARGFTTAVLLTQPHQIVRAMLGVVRTIYQQGVSMSIWCVVPGSTDWNKAVMGSQGMERKPRRDHIADEIERVFRYQASGDLASFEELFAYLKLRDNRQA